MYIQPKFIDSCAHIYTFWNKERAGARVAICVKRKNIYKSVWASGFEEDEENGRQEEHVE